MAITFASRLVRLGLPLLFMAVAIEAQAPVTSGLPGNWSYIGCYNDQQASRTLGGAQYQDGSVMTVQSCLQFCGSKNYGYAGIEYGGECYCGFKINANANSIAETSCNMGCTGNKTQACGGSNALTMYNSGQGGSGPITNPGPGNWTSIGCVVDSVASRTFRQNPATPGGVNNMTIGSCMAACAAGGYTLAGAEYGGQCWCDSMFVNGLTYSPSVDDCAMPCNGNSSELCGGPNRLNAYTTLGWKYQGCYSDNPNSPTLANNVPVPGGGQNMTTEACTNACQNGNYTFAGTESGNTCFCGNSTTNGSPAPDASCNTQCSNSTYELCGGQGYLGLYQFRGPIPFPTPTPSPTPPSGGGPGPTSTPTPKPTALPTGWTSKGCWKEGINGRALTQQQNDDDSMTVASCVAACAKLGYSVAGAEFGKQCFCDNFMHNNATNVTSTDCNMACAGDPNGICGGPDRLSVYSNTTLKTYVPPTVQKTNLPGAWAYQGCLQDIADKRVLPYQLELKPNNTATNCLSLCSQYGYGVGGMEFGFQCFCGDMGTVQASGAKFVDDSMCNQECTGNSSYTCGGPSLISLYKWNKNNLTRFRYASGVAAGAYQFLIGGVVIPLVTSAGRNGKVTFVEKFGTSPANNGTGAYELDLAQVNNFTGAWRPMHVKTDVFCSASLVLPDRGARQINIGGWANDATYGVRLYWPDGKPGKWGQNDWQENVKEVSLQAGRWYPSAMIMANGSILVVGGQVGSNGAPVPSLELLPKTGPTVYCDYLDRTDPYNLYPFLAVLPGGGIFIQYYNEARILDEVTLQTKKVLPNPPSAVNNFLGGRTYPFEGSMALLPQYAPYTDPLTVFVCGGSTPFAEVAIDNCVSIQPDAPTPKWTIERMPSKRVESNIVALPDGTYLIINGGMAGRAGFGTSSQPNLNAVLYNPTLPVNNRMTVMANTTIGRLYHSEAILLDDGRVLVSGSDPEDNTYPQEYRVETFLPPYLTSGAARPNFTIPKIDWVYGKSYNFTYSGAGTPKVSLIGATASTHGSNMGQRTIFPAVSCSGTACTVTAPPNNHVCPPGWFQMFVLSNGTPSNALWIRIGGDPGKLGNWPPFPDFTNPGVGAMIPVPNSK